MIINKPVSQLSPAKPGWHSQVVMLPSFVQFPWTQWHSLISAKSIKINISPFIALSKKHWLIFLQVLFNFLRLKKLMRKSCRLLVLPQTDLYYVQTQNIINRINKPVSQLTLDVWNKLKVKMRPNGFHISIASKCLL